MCVSVCECVCVCALPNKWFGVHQSDIASVKIPEIDLELASGTLGGLVTTVEGLITNISESEFIFMPFILC